MTLEHTLIAIGSGELKNYPTWDELKVAYLEHVLSKCKNKKAAASRILGINRRTLYRRGAKNHE